MIILSVAFLLPIVACVMFALLQGEWIGNFYLPASQWNDELLYYKQVEGVIGHGFPQGYFGYNESTAQSLTFSAWSPVIMWIYVLWGMLFGWNYSAPVICNILMLSVAMVFFVYKAKPGCKQMGTLSAFVVLFIPISRFMLSCMADCEIIALMMIYTGFYVDHCRAEQENGFAPGNVIGMISCGVLLTLMRPYFLLLFFIPMYYYWKRKKMGVLVVSAIAGIMMVLYAYIAGKFTAAYFSPLINTKWIQEIFANPVQGIKSALRIFVYGLRDILEQCTGGIVNGTMEGGLWTLFLCLFVAISYIAIRYRKHIVWVLILIALLGAIIMFYDIRVGSRHLLPFLIPIVLLLCCWNCSRYAVGVLAVVCVLFTCRIGADEYNYQFPSFDRERADAIFTLQEQLVDEIEVTKNADYWDNTVIWMFYDDTVLTWQDLYALPKGTGINLCMPDYLLENSESLKAKYIAVNTGQRIDKLFEQSEAERIAEHDGITIWKLRE